MSEEKRELLEKLKFELAFVEDGGYGRSVRTPQKSTSPFQDSLTCLNFGDPSRPHPCDECILMQFVPESRRGEDVSVTIFRSMGRIERSSTWMRPRPKRRSSNGFAARSTGLKESWRFRT